MIRSLFALALAIGAAAPAAAAIVRYDFAGTSFSYTQSTACPTLSTCSSSDFFPSEDSRTEGWLTIDTARLAAGETYVDPSGYEVRYGGSGSGLGGDGSVAGGVAVTGGGLPALAFETDGTQYYEVAFEPASPGNRTSIFAQQRQVLARELDAGTGAVIHEILRYTQLGVYIYDAPMDLFGSLSLPAILDGFRADVSAVSADYEYFYDPFGSMTGFFANTRQTSVVVDTLARAATEISGGNLLLAVMLILGISAPVSGVIDNIPYVATMTPIVAGLAAAIPSQGNSDVLWWALALGADFGGNLTAVGASANVVMLGIAKRADHPISFWEFTRKGIVVTVVSVTLAALYLWLRYFVWA